MARKRDPKKNLSWRATLGLRPSDEDLKELVKIHAKALRDEKAMLKKADGRVAKALHRSEIKDIEKTLKRLRGELASRKARRKKIASRSKRNPKTVATRLTLDEKHVLVLALKHGQVDPGKWEARKLTKRGLLKRSAWGYGLTAKGRRTALAIDQRKLGQQLVERENPGIAPGGKSGRSRNPETKTKAPKRNPDKGRLRALSKLTRV
jgi:hypothetical protein